MRVINASPSSLTNSYLMQNTGNSYSLGYLKYMKPVLVYIRRQAKFYLSSISEAKFKVSPNAYLPTATNSDITHKLHQLTSKVCGAANSLKRSTVFIFAAYAQTKAIA